MALSELYSKDVKIWIPDPNSVWIGATVLHFYKDNNIIKIITDDGKIIELKLNQKLTSNESNFPYLRNPEILIGQKDLTYLSYLNEPEVLYNLKIRFCERREIYTYCGIVLVAINPYMELSIYGNEIINAYHLQNSHNLDPHIFAVAENAFRRMSNFDENQSVIVSGESGAGKTVSAKFTMRYFALVGGSKSRQSSYNLNETQIERKVLSSNPILEAMGNAKTIRNDNSSRFGKYLEIIFNKRNQITGANMSTYLLEKSRVVFQNLGERNYHIFYQIVRHSQSGDELLTNCRLVDNVENYYYLRCGESLEIDGVDDSEEFLVTKNSFLQLGMDTVQLKSICEILAAILHLGNVQFKSEDATESCTISNPELLKLSCELLGCSFNQMKIWLCYRTISTFQETLHKPLSKTDAQCFRDALVKTIYSNLFDWIVKQVNKSLSSEANCRPSKHSKKVINRNEVSLKKFIGVLDIYGFETFEENSFEQFCINFANEKLQLQFNMHVFKLEQEEYMKEGLEWTFIDYYNNQPCIDLIELKLGLLDLLDEECKMLKGTDENWCCKIYSHHLNKSSHFSKPKMSNSAFLIEHFAGNVEYQCSGFIEKNRDTVLEEQINLLKASDIPFVAELFFDNDEEIPNSKVKVNVTASAKFIQSKKQENIRKMKKTVGSQFRQSLKSLMETLNKTNPHYIRCIKPNDLKLPFTFCPERAVQQLRACGVLETIRLSAAGFPSRWSYHEFFLRYYILINRKTIQTLDCKLASQAIVESIIEPRDSYRFGHSKLFFRAGQVAYLEKLRAEKINTSVTLIQSIFRGSLERKKYLNTLKLVIELQTLIRRKAALTKVNYLRQKRASTKIQSFYRMYIARKRFLEMKKATLTIEAWWCKMALIKLKQAYKKEKDIILCQSIVRKFIQRSKYLKMRKGIILLQNHFRRRKAKVELRILKMEAKSFKHIKFVNKGLENKIIELTQRLDDKEKENMTMTNKITREKKIEIELFKQNQTETTRNYQNTIQDLQAEIIKLKKELNKEILDKNKIISEKEIGEACYKKNIMDLQNELDILKSSIKSYQQIIELPKVEVSPCQSTNQEHLREQLDHQKLVHDYEILEIKYENLYKEFKFTKSGKVVMDSVDFAERSSNSSETDSASRDDGDIDTLSEGDNVKSRKVSGLVITKPIPPFNQNVGTAGDLAVVMQLQMRINSISQENHRLKELIQELEDQLLKYKHSMENQVENQVENHVTINGVDKELYALIKDIKNTDDHGTKSRLIDKIINLKNQLKCQTEEYQKLRRNMFSGTLGKLADDLDSECRMIHGEEAELLMAFESQKEANRKMLKEIEEIKSQDLINRKTLVQVRKEKEQLQIQIGKLSDLIGNLKLTPKERLDKFVQNEISRILIENMRLQEKNDMMSSESIQLKRGLKYFAWRLQKYEGSLVPNPDNEDQLLQLVQNVIYNSKLISDGKKECYSEVGLIDLTMSELPLFIKTFIIDLTPDNCLKYEPYHIVPYIIFLIARKFDVFHEEENLISFLTKVISVLKKTIRKKKDYIEYLAMWMSNVFCLINLFQQYSGVEQFSRDNNPEENKHNFTSYDLSVIIRLLKELCINIFEFTMRYIVEHLVPQSLCINAILLYEDIKTSLSKDGSKHTSSDIENQPRNTSFNILMKHLQAILDILKTYHVPSELINQLFVHIGYLINAHCLNNLLFREDLCHFSKGVQIRYNISSFETWLRCQKLGYNGVLKCLSPMIEAVQLLQTMFKTEDDAHVVCDMCEYLNTAQVIKILYNFNPKDGWGSRIPSDLISRIETLLRSKRSNRSIDDKLESPTTIQIPLDIPFIHNTQSMNQIIIPNSLYLPCLNILTEKDLVG